MIFNRIRHWADRLDGSGRPQEDSRRFAECETVGFRRSRASRGGFTLIELLVVLGIIAAVIGGVGLALRGGDGTVALGAGQRTMASMLAATRGQAVMNGTNARLIVHVDPNDAELYLRKVGIIRKAEIGGSTGWVPTSEGTTLPRGTYFVPDENASFSGQPLMPPIPSDPDLFGEDWDEANDAISAYAGLMQIAYPSLPSGGNFLSEGSGPVWAYYEFGPDGQMTDASPNLQIVLTTGRRTPSTPVLENPENVRGMVLRRIGTFHTVGERLTFHETN